MSHRRGGEASRFSRLPLSRVRAATTYVIVSVLSSVIFLSAIAAIYAAAGTVNLQPANANLRRSRSQLTARADSTITDATLNYTLAGGNSGAIGGVYSFTPGLALALNSAVTERAPTYYELFANGPHAATGSYEVGDATFAKEKSRAFDAALRMRSGAHSGSLSVFHTRFKNYIGVFNSGNRRGAGHPRC